MTKTASVREVQHNLSEMLVRIQDGEEVTITRRGLEVARLVPPRRRAAKAQWPDFEARMKRHFPAGPDAGKPVSQIVLDDRDER